MIVDGHIEHDEGPILPSLEQPGNFHRLSVKERRHLPHLLGASKGHDLQGDWQIHVRLRHQSSKHGTYLLEVKSDIAAAFVAGISDHGKIGRPYFHPLRSASETPL